MPLRRPAPRPMPGRYRGRNSPREWPPRMAAYIGPGRCIMRTCGALTDGAGHARDKGPPPVLGKWFVAPYRPPRRGHKLRLAAM